MCEDTLQFKTGVIFIDLMVGYRSGLGWCSNTVLLGVASSKWDVLPVCY